jgi:O6-methylguanine-DNA--protein-cysteine methyltransferase
MPSRKNSPSTTFDQAQKIKETWNNIDQKATYGQISLPELEEAITKLENDEAKVSKLLDQLTGARAEREEQRYKVWDLLKRIKSGVKATYGDDSDEYKRFGGTKLSERNTKGKNTTPKTS